MDFAVSVLDLAQVGRHETVAESLAASVELARCAERHGFERVWYAEHHNIARIASSATSVLIAHIAANTERIRLGSGGIMLPNHSPLVIAEQFGTLAELHPGRIDLGLGRAPGTDRVTITALRRDPMAAERFPEDVLELQAYLGERSRVPGVEATPGRGTNVPIYILGSSLFGAQLAAHLGLPYAFASHFAPTALRPALRTYRENFRPSGQLAEPYAIAAFNVITAETEAEAELEATRNRRSRVRLIYRGPNGPLSDEEADSLLATGRAPAAEEMVHYTAAGTPAQVREQVGAFATSTGVDEVMVVPQGSTIENRHRSLDLLGSELGLRGHRSEDAS